jgi:hypothetical protein
MNQAMRTVLETGDVEEMLALLSPDESYRMRVSAPPCPKGHLHPENDVTGSVLRWGNTLWVTSGDGQISIRQGADEADTHAAMLHFVEGFGLMFEAAKTAMVALRGELPQDILAMQPTVIHMIGDEVVLDGTAFADTIIPTHYPHAW